MFSSGTKHFYCSTMYCLQDKYAKIRSNSIFQYLSIFWFRVIILYNHKRCEVLIWNVMSATNKLKIVVCDFGAKFSSRNLKQCCMYVCMLVSKLPVCLQPISSHITATLHQLISYLWMCDVYSKLLYHEEMAAVLTSATKLMARYPHIAHPFEKVEFIS